MIACCPTCQSENLVVIIHKLETWSFTGVPDKNSNVQLDEKIDSWRSYNDNHEFFCPNCGTLELNNFLNKTND